MLQWMLQSAQLKICIDVIQYLEGNKEIDYTVKCFLITNLQITGNQ